MRLVSMYDKAMKAFNPPIPVNGVGAFARLLSDELNKENPTEMFAKHPKDFSLFEVGSFDETTGKVVPVEPTFLLELESLVS
nr:MAG: nonstructural protein [Microviridae sp.]